MHAGASQHNGEGLNEILLELIGMFENFFNFTSHVFTS